MARTLQDILTDDSRSRREATFAAAELALAERKKMAEHGHLNTNPTSQLAAQQTKLRGTRALLTAAETDTAGQSGPLSRAERLTELGIKVQSAGLKTDTQPTDPTSVTLPATTMSEHDAPSAAAFAILEAQNVEATTEQAGDIRALDELSEPVRRQLTDVLDAYLGYYLTIQTSARGNVSRVRAAQLQLLEEATDLETALETTDGSGSTGPASNATDDPDVHISGVVLIDLARDDNTYEEDFNLQIDAGGDDIYNNNAGGANASGNSSDVAALIDFGGNDRYNGRNGGGQYRVTKASPSLPAKDRGLSLPKKGEAAGFLLDAGTGDDTYTAEAHGSNGGGRRGIGFLVDGGGTDTYTGNGKATNGAGSRKGTGFLLDAGTGNDNYDGGNEGVSNGGASGGRGFLFDVGGDDTYNGSNGAAHRRLVGTGLPIPCGDALSKTVCRILPSGVPMGRKIPQSGGFLLDGAGTDIYRGGNGGAGYRGAGFLLDAGTGDDTYDGKNGAASTRGSGFLLDTGGNDRYLATHHTTNGAGRSQGLGFLMDGGTGDDIYDATTGNGPTGPRGNRLGPGSLGTNGGGWQRGRGFLADRGGNDSYIAGSVGTNGGAIHGLHRNPRKSSTGFLLDAGGDDRYTAVEVAVNGGASGAIGLLYDNSGTDHYTERRYRCIDCSDIPKGAVGAQIDRRSGGKNDSRQTSPSEVLVVDDTAGADNADCSDASFQAIQPAVKAAEPGDTVRVCAGTYPGNVTLATRNVRLEAAEPGQVVLDGANERRFGVALVASRVTVNGFTATNFSGVAFLALGPETTVSDTTISDSGHGIISAGLYRGGAFQDLPVTTPVMDGKQSTVIANNTVRNTKFGIKVAGTGNVRVASNTVTVTQHAISVLAAKGVTIHNNTVSGQGVLASKSQGGITSVRSGDITMTWNTVTGFTAPDQWDERDAFSYGYGINIRNRGGEDASHTLRHNTMADNKFNLILGSGEKSTYKHFTIPPSNTVNGKPVVYLVGAVGATIGPGGIRNLTLDRSVVPNTTLTDTQALSIDETPGYVACVRCVGVTVQDLDLSHNGQGVLFVKSRRVQVTNVTIHDTVMGLGLRTSSTQATLTDNTIRETGVAVKVIHTCDVGRGEKNADGLFRQVTSGSFLSCANPSVLIANNTITRIGNRFPGEARHSRAIRITGKGVILRDNAISDVLGTGITLFGGPKFRTSGIVLGGRGLQQSPKSIFASQVIHNSISDARVGLRARGTEGTTVAANTIRNTAVGLIVRGNSQNTYRDNTVTNATTGMFVTVGEFDLTARNNTFRKVEWGLDVQFLYLANPPRAPASHDFGTSNTVNGERILWLKGVVSRSIDADDANMVVCVQCVDVTIRQMTITDNAHGIVLWDSTSTRVTNVTVTDTKRTGVLIRGGANNTVQDSTIIDATEPIWVFPIEPRSISLFGQRAPVNRPAINQEKRDVLGPMHILNNRITVDNASYPDRTGTYLTKPAIWGHFGITLHETTTAVVRGNNITENRWGIHAKRGSHFDTRIENNTITHAREPVGRGRVGSNIGRSPRSTLGIKIQGNVAESSNGSVVIRNNSLTAGTSPPGKMDHILGITVKGAKVSKTLITSNTVQGYQHSVRIGTGWNNTTVSIRRNRLTGAKSASVFLLGKTPGEAVEIHQNLLNPGRFGYGVKFSRKGGGGGHMGSEGSGGSGGGHTVGGHQPVNATCNRWAAPSGPSSVRMTLVDPVTGEPADGNGSAVSRGHMHGESNVRFHPWLGESPRLSCTKAKVGTPTPTPIPGPTRTPWPTAGAGGGPGPGQGDGPGPGQGDGPGPGPGPNTAQGGDEGTSTVTARLPATATNTATPPPTATPEIVPGFGVVVWLVTFGLLVVLLTVRRRD